jgi:predicted CXXCH cytochrome family protein
MSRELRSFDGEWAGFRAAVGRMFGPVEHRRWIVGALRVVVPALAGLLALGCVYTARAASPAEEPARFVGGQVCAGCHQPEAKLWSGSHHDKAMQRASEETVLGDFSGATLTHFGATSTFFRKDGKFFVNTSGADGKPRDFEIAYTFGVYPLQQYLVAFPGGRYQALPLAWDSRPKADGGQRWFHLYPKEAIQPGDPLYWTGMNQTWNYMCADCHSTGLRRNYDLASDSYKTSWSDIDVSCEACHGPGSRHVAWASAPAGGPADASKGLVAYLADRGGGRFVLDPGAATAHRTAPRESNAEIETCAFCHARRHEIAASFGYGRPLLDSAVPSLLEAGVYFPDGQIQEEDYEYGSFLQSRMYAMGVTCSNCHEPHGLKLRAAGNQVCAQCHRPASFDTTAHHHHQPGSAGAECANCHMPTRTYMVIDARRDHAIRIPRPDLSAALGTPNACTNCHADRSAAWAAGQVAGWYGPNRRAEPHYGAIIDAGRKGEPGADAALAALILDGQQPGIVRATGLSLLPGFAADIGPDEIKAYLAGVGDGDPLVRMAAIDALAPFAPEQRAAVAAPLLDDKVAAVRIAAARALAAAPAGALTPDQQAALERDSAELIAAERASAERPEAQLTIGASEAEAGNFAAAEAAYRAGLRLDPRSAPLMVNLADLYRAVNQDSRAEPVLRQAIAAAPDYAPAYHALGLLLARSHDMPGALAALQKAVVLAPEDGRYAYVYAIALNSAGKVPDAVAVLKQAGARHPADADILSALATISRDSGDRAAAIAYAEQLVKAVPNDRQARALLESLRAP